MTEATSVVEGQAPGPLAGVAITAIVLVVIAAWVVVGMQFFSDDKTLFGGFLLLWHWVNNEAMEIKRLPSAITGALIGIFLAWFVVFATGSWGGAGIAAGLLLIVAALYLDVIKALPFAVNSSTTLFLTIAAAPLVQLSVNWTELVLSVVIGGLFFGVLIEGIKQLAAKFGGN